jgi:hypothetical protein
MKNIKEAGKLLFALGAMYGLSVLVSHFGVAHGLVLATTFIGWADGSVGALPQKRGEAGVVTGGRIFKGTQAWAKKTTDGNGTIYFLAEIPSDAIITEIKLMNDALTGASSADEGIIEIDPGLSNLGGANQTAAQYYAGSPAGAVPVTVAAPKIDAGAIFMSANDISAGNTAASAKDVLFGSSANIASQTVTAASNPGLLIYNYKLWALLGFTDPKWKSDSYALGLRLNTAGSAAGNLAVPYSYVQG